MTLTKKMCRVVGYVVQIVKFQFSNRESFEPKDIALLVYMNLVFRMKTYFLYDTHLIYVQLWFEFCASNSLFINRSDVISALHDTWSTKRSFIILFICKSRILGCQSSTRGRNFYVVVYTMLLYPPPPSHMVKDARSTQKMCKQYVNKNMHLDYQNLLLHLYSGFLSHFIFFRVSMHFFVLRFFTLYAM